MYVSCHGETRPYPTSRTCSCRLRRNCAFLIKPQSANARARASSRTPRLDSLPWNARFALLRCLNLLQHFGRFVNQYMSGSYLFDM